MKLIALKSHTADGNRRYRKGQAYEISDASAKLLIAAKLAAPAQPEEQKVKYKRRDMRAEGTD